MKTWHHSCVEALAHQHGVAMLVAGQSEAVTASDPQVP